MSNFKKQLLAVIGRLSASLGQRIKQCTFAYVWQTYDT